MAYDEAAVRSELEAKRADLLLRMAGISAAPSDSGGISFGKRVGDGTSIAVERLTQVAAHEKMLEQLAEVERALAKLDEWFSGINAEQRNGIWAATLDGRVRDVHPSATRCVACAAG